MDNQSVYFSFYIPDTKGKLVKWLSEYYEAPKARFTKMAKKQLLAVYINTRRRLGR